MSNFPLAEAARTEVLKRLHNAGLWIALLGAGLIILGFVALGSAFTATLATVAVIGGIMVAGGVLHIVNSFFARTWGGFGAHLLAGILVLIMGLLMLEQPLATAGVFTLMLAASFTAGGLLRSIMAVSDRFPGWPWVLLSGLVSIALGVMIWRQLPASAIWVIGTFVGIDLIMCGVTWLMLGLSARRVAA